MDDPIKDVSSTFLEDATKEAAKKMNDRIERIVRTELTRTINKHAVLIKGA